MRPAVERVENAADLGVGEGDTGEVVTDRGGPEALVADRFQVVGFTER